MHVSYKYLPPERIGYFDDELLRITQPAELNDPFECLPVLPDITETIDIANQVLEMRLKEIDALKTTKQQKRDHRLQMIISTKREITKIKKNEPGNIREYFFRQGIEKTNARLGILSLSMRWNSSLMWAHYTQSHKGFCVGFDVDDSFFSDYITLSNGRKLFLPVKYSDERIKVAIKRHEKTDPMVLLTKSTDWEYEQEQRLIVSLTEADKKINADPYPICLYKIPHSLIREIIIGTNASSNLVDRIKAFVNKNNIATFRSVISPTRFDMERSAVE